MMTEIPLTTMQSGESTSGVVPGVLVGGPQSEESVCDICGKVYANGTYMRKHQKEIHSEINSEHQECPKCPLKFRSLKTFWKHIIAIHEGGGTGETFPIPESRREDVVEERREAKCPECGKMFLTTSRLIRHMNNVHLHPEADLVIKCVRCGKEFQEEETLEEHIKEVHERSILDLIAFPCNLCKITFTSVDRLWIHKTKVHNLNFNIELAPTPVTCQYCEETVYTHYSTHIKQFHSEAGGPPPCEQCGRRFEDWKTLKRHLETVHATLRAFSCHICGKTFKDRTSVQAHLQVHANISLEPNVKAMLKSVFGTVCNKTFTCGLCQTVVYSSMEAKIHLYIKHPNNFKEFMKEAARGIPCPSCNEGFQTKELVVSHLEMMHPEHQIPTCKFCGHKELTERYMNFHHKEFHPQESRYFCKLCNIAFSNGRGLNFHNKREHGNGAGQCPYCPEKHIKVKMHVTKKHPEKAVEYHKLIKDAIRDEAEARMKFNDFLDPGSAINARNRKKPERVAGDEVEDSDTSDDEDEEEMLIERNEKPLLPVETPTEHVTLPNYRITKDSTTPHVIEVHRVEAEAQNEQEDNIDVKPFVANLEQTHAKDFTSQHNEASNNSIVCKPFTVRVAKLSDSELRKWTCSVSNKTSPSTSVKDDSAPKYSMRKRRRL